MKRRLLFLNSGMFILDFRNIHRCVLEGDAPPVLRAFWLDIAHRNLGDIDGGFGEVSLLLWIMVKEDKVPTPFAFGF